MITFNECRIDEEGKCLIVEASVTDMSYFDNVYISSVRVDTDSTFVSDSSPSEKSVEIDLDSDLSEKTMENGKVKSVRLYIRAADLGLSTLNDRMLFVFIRSAGVPEPGCPCGMDREYSMCVSFNMKPIYLNAMNYIRELGSKCTIPSGFIDMILRIHAFGLALKTGNYNIAIKEWNNRVRTDTPVSSKRGCGCNGYYI